MTGFPARRRDGVLQVRREGAEWLSTGANGGRIAADCAYNVTVPDDWPRTDLAAYVDARRDRAGFPTAGPVLLTGVDVADARGARCGPVTAYATAGLSNPAALPPDPAGGDLPESVDPAVGTVNVIVGTDRRLEPGALANLLTVVAEAKAATLLATAGVPGTTTDAVIVGHAPAGESVRFSGSATRVGAATRACVREAVTAALDAHYADRDERPSDAAAGDSEGVSTEVRATVFRPTRER